MPRAARLRTRGENLPTVRICWAEALVGRGADWYM